MSVLSHLGLPAARIEHYVDQHRCPASSLVIEEVGRGSRSAILQIAFRLSPNEETTATIRELMDQTPGLIIGYDFRKGPHALHMRTTGHEEESTGRERIESARRTIAALLSKTNTDANTTTL